MRVKMGMMRCSHCGYTWKPKVEHPRRCPMCSVTLPHWKQWKREQLAKLESKPIHRRGGRSSGLKHLIRGNSRIIK